jgi:hypothetical protein
MRIRLMIAGFVAAGSIAHAPAQARSTADRGATMLVSLSADRARPLTASSVSAGEILREIDDPQNGDRWLLVEDASHPGGPGLLLQAGEGVVETRPTVAAADAPVPIIHAGERIVVEEHTAIVDARLEAVAMNPAWAGSLLNVRLVVGGRVMWAGDAGESRGAGPRGSRIRPRHA